MKNILIYCTTIGFLFMPVHAQVKEAPSKASPQKIASEPVYGRWRASMIGGGGYHQRVILCPTNPFRYYTYVDTAGMFRSDDAGETWRLITAGMTPRIKSYDIRSLVVDPRNEDVVLAAVSNTSGIYRTTDGGNTWEGVLPGVNFYGNGPYRWAGQVIAFQPGNPDTVLAATGGTGLFKSTDGGKTWVKKGLDGFFGTHVFFDAKNPNNVWLCTVACKTKFGPIGEYKGGLYYSADAGETWQLVIEKSPVKMVQDPVNSNTFYGISSDTLEVCISRDRAKTWEKFTDGLAVNSDPSDLKDHLSKYRYRALEAGPDFILCGSLRGTIYRLPLGKTKWELVELQSVDYGDRQWKIADHPGSWPPDQFQRERHFGSAMSNIMVDPRDPNHWMITDWYAIYQSWDAGRNWKLTIKGIESTAVLWVRQDPTDPKRVYLNMSDNGFFFSDDGGMSFKKTKPDFPSANAKTTDFSPKKAERIWVTGNREGGSWVVNQLYVSDDRGTTWKHALLKGLPVLDDSTRGENVEEGKDLRRLDVVTVNPQNPNEIFLTVSGEVAPNKGGVYQSVDGGVSWSWFGQGLPDNLFSPNFWTRGNQLVIHPDGGMLLYGENSKKGYRFDKALQKWVQLDIEPGNARLAVDRFTPGRFYVGIAKKGVFSTDDEGKTWNLIYPCSSNISAIQTDHAKPGRVVVALPETFMYSADSGKTWTDLDPDRRLPCLAGQGMAFAGDHLVMATQTCGAYWIDLSK